MMASKASQGRRIGKKVVEAVKHPPFLKTHIPSGQARPAPPLGPQLGTRNIQIAQFCKDFNERTKNHKPGIRLPTRIYVKPDKSYELIIMTPIDKYFLCNAAGVKKGAMYTGEIVGKVTLKHIYEIAKIKSQDLLFEHWSLERICKRLIESSYTMGIQVVKEDLDPEEYGKFLEESWARTEAQEQAIEETRAAKLLRLKDSGK